MITEASPYGRARDPSSLGLPTSVGVSHNVNVHSLTYSMNQLGLSHHNDRPSSPRLWESQVNFVFDCYFILIIRVLKRRMI